MADITFTCPRCLFTAKAAADVRFCPRCGLEDVARAAVDHAPLDVVAAGRTFRVHEQIGVGSLCGIYRCTFLSGSKTSEGIFKIARDALSNERLTNEAAVLRRLAAANDAALFSPFLPAVEESFDFSDGPASSPRRANVLRMHPEINSPHELYSLEEVRAAYPAGLDGRDVAWIWRRLLSIIGFAHDKGIVHGAVLPMHVLIEPRDHKLILIDWCCAVDTSQHGPSPTPIVAGGYADWYRREIAANRPPTPALDVSFAARCMIELLAGDPVQGEFPATLDSALQRYFNRCLANGSDRPVNARQLLGDFDHLIEVLWGPRQFRVLTMPPKRRG